MITFERGTFKEHFPVMGPFFQAHWEEIGRKALEGELNVDYHQFIVLEECGCFCGVKAVKDGEMIGYISCIMTPYMHQAHKKVANINCFYVEPKYRKRSTASGMIKKLEEELKAEGVSSIFIPIPTFAKPAKWLLNSLKYKAIDIVYHKSLGE